MIEELFDAILLFTDVTAHANAAYSSAQPSIRQLSLPQNNMDSTANQLQQRPSVHPPCRRKSLIVQIRAYHRRASYSRAAASRSDRDNKCTAVTHNNHNGSRLMNGNTNKRNTSANNNNNCNNNKSYETWQS